MKFKMNEAVSCGSSYLPTKVELKASLKAHKQALMKQKEYMKLFSEMSNSYTYGNQEIERMVGSCYMEISNIKEQIKETKKKIKEA